MNKLNKGFTLVELAIVLVIIGLIVSSVLVGQDLIKAAELRATTRQLQEFQSGVNSFIGKYKQLPGDIDGDKFGLTGGCDDPTTNGDGDQDGLIEDSAGGSTLHNGEISCFWSNLTTSGKELVSGVFDGFEGAASATVNDVVGENLPKMKFGGSGWGVFSTGGENFFVTGVTGSQADDGYDTTNIFVPIDAFNLDSKIDDGVPTTGNIQSRGAGNNNPNTAAGTAAAVSTTVCNNTASTPNEYQFTASTEVCNLIFKMMTF